ncbi:S1 family peptidase [Microbacterium oryzae]|uniref:S1 family peptidase n=1 Tax=Microbacterium oryzae TaxID=743009 RepID=UPI0025B2097B|nr:S1 family peptidase [Microbacterium oryzae]MDN3310424.1 S1 family peptidase [Microbacterium oryzae]
MKPSITRAARLGALGVASALAFGGVAATSASATEAPSAPTEGEAFDALAFELFQDDSVTGVLHDGSGQVIVQQLESEGAGAAAKRIQASATAAEVANTYGNVKIVTVTEDELAKPTAATDVVGGYGIALFPDSGSQGAVCSVGFPAWSPSGDPAVLTAGHCTEDGAFGNIFLTDPAGDTAGGGAEDNSTVAPTYALGTIGFSQFGGAGNSEGGPGDALDVTAIDVINDDLDLIPAMTDWANTDDLSASLASNITGVGTAQIGATVQRSGRTTGYSAGPVDTDRFVSDVEAEGYLMVDDRIVKGFAAATQAIPGDSGGTILQGSTAVGIVSGTFRYEGEEHMWGADLQANLEGTGGYSVMLDIAEAEVTSLESGANISWNAPISGTAAANSTLEYAFVSQGSDASFENSATTAVDGSGNWQIQGPSTPGDYTVYFRVKSGFDTSDVTSFDTQVFPTAPGIISPENGQSFTEPVTAISGNAAPNTEVTLSGDVTAKVTSDDEGNWSHAVELGEGSYSVSAQQTVNGKTSAAATVEFTVGAAAPSPAPEPEQPAAPEAPAFINPSNDGGSYVEGSTPGTVTGEGINGATVELRVNDELVGSATVEANVWSIQIGALPVGEHTIAARQIVDGVASADNAVTVTVTAAAAPQDPQSEEPQQAPDDENPQAEQPQQDGQLEPTGAEFDATAPLALGFGLVFAAGGVLLIARQRQLKSER